MIVKYQGKYWEYHGQKNGELLMLESFGAGQTVEAASKDVEIMKTFKQLSEVAKFFLKESEESDGQSRQGITRGLGRYRR